MLFSLVTFLSILALAFAAPAPVPAAKDEPLLSRNLNSLLTAILDAAPGLEGDINDITGVLTAAEELLAVVTGTQTTYNELATKACTAYTIIFARGTSEPGNVGILAGPPLFDALTSLVGSSALTIQGVNDYGATVGEFLEGGDPAGSAEMAAQIEAALTKCPNTKLAIGGYSQGGQIVHNAVALLPAATAAKISSVVIFGDPDDGKAVANVDSSKVLVVCHTGDDICLGGDLILLPHLTYGEDATTAASFIVAA
ncbi:cutinase-6 [Coleophoma cylindrospora]|uniref:cutinase n=1 Tax=Coleophoma cylindrospora TaxID=1849047 RepID=A0A3D8QW49_9HELO|nr:cutinase-6 [Coleophoma cylindrospora]